MPAKKDKVNACARTRTLPPAFHTVVGYDPSTRVQRRINAYQGMNSLNFDT
jgi:hypothetical protein